MTRYIAILLLCVGLASCFKYIKVDNSIKYTVSGIHDLTIDQNDSAFLYIGVQLQSGNPANEYIQTSVTGFPDSVFVNLDSITFRPNYNFSLRLGSRYPKPGIYPIRINMTSPTMGAKTYAFNLTVTSIVDCTSQLGVEVPYNYNWSRHQVTMYGLNYYAYVFRQGCDTVTYRIMKDTVEYPGDPTSIVVQQFNAVVNCNANTLTIYPQSTQPAQASAPSVSGSGTFVPNGATAAIVTITDTVTSGSQSSVSTFTIY